MNPIMLNQITIGDIRLLVLDREPMGGVGIEAEIGTLAVVQGAAGIYQKTGSGHKDWKLSSIDAEQLGLDLNAIDARLDVLESDPVTKSYVDTADGVLDDKIDQEIADRQAAVSAEQTARESADNALDARLDIIEGPDSQAGSITKALKDAKAYTDGEVTTLKGGVSSGYDTLKKIEDKIEFVVENTDPAALDSLKEIVTAFQSADSNINTAINTLAGAASSNLAAETAAREAEDLTFLKLDGSRPMEGNLDMASHAITGVQFLNFPAMSSVGEGNGALTVSSAGPLALTAADGAQIQLYSSEIPINTYGGAQYGKIEKTETELKLSTPDVTGSADSLGIRISTGMPEEGNQGVITLGAGQVVAEGNLSAGNLYAAGSVTIGDPSAARMEMGAIGAYIFGADGNPRGSLALDQYVDTKLILRSEGELALSTGSSVALLDSAGNQFGSFSTGATETGLEYLNIAGKSNYYGKMVVIEDQLITAKMNLRIEAINNTDVLVSANNGKLTLDSAQQVILGASEKVSARSATEVEMVVGDPEGINTKLSVTSAGFAFSGQGDIDAGSRFIKNLSAGVDSGDAVNKGQLDTAIANLVNSAPEVLDTLKELADALGSDPNFATTIAGQIGTLDDKIDQEIADRIADVNAEESARIAAVSAEASARAAADTAEASARAAEDLTFVKLDGSRAMSGDLDMGANDVKNVGALGLGTSSPASIFEMVDNNVKHSFRGTSTSTTGSVNAVVASLTPAADSVELVKIMVTGMDGASKDSVSYERTVRVKNVGGTVSLGIVQSDYTSEDPSMAGANCTFIVNASDVDVRVTGVNSKTITWKCLMRRMA